MTFGGDYAKTTYHAAKFREQGRWHVDIAGIQRGDIVFFDWGGSDKKRLIDHVGIVTGVGAGGGRFCRRGPAGRAGRRRAQGGARQGSRRIEVGTR